MSVVILFALELVFFYNNKHFITIEISKIHREISYGLICRYIILNDEQFHKMRIQLSLRAKRVNLKVAQHNRNIKNKP